MNLGEIRDWLTTQTIIPYAIDQVDDMINQAYLNVATSHAWPWNFGTDTFNLVVGTASYEIDVVTTLGFYKITNVLYTGEGLHAQPKPTTRDSVLARFGDDVGDSDLPAEFYQENQTHLVFVPTPSSTQQVRLLGHFTPAPLVLDADLPTFHSAFHIVLAELTAAFYYESEESFQMAAEYHARAERTLERMRTFYDTQLPAEKIIIGGGVWQPGRLPYVGWETAAGI